MRKEFVGLRAKIYSYLKDNNDKECLIKQKLKFQDYKSYLEAPQIENEINYLEKR